MVLASLGISTPGELVKSDVGQITFPEIPISRTSGSGAIRIFFSKFSIDCNVQQGWRDAG